MAENLLILECVSCVSKTRPFNIFGLQVMKHQEITASSDIKLRSWPLNYEKTTGMRIREGTKYILILPH